MEMSVCLSGSEALKNLLRTSQEPPKNLPRTPKKNPKHFWSCACFRFPDSAFSIGCNIL